MATDVRAQTVRGNPHVVPRCPIAAPNGTNFFRGGSIVKTTAFWDSSVLYGLVDHEGTGDGTQFRGLTVMEHMKIPKLTGAGKSFAWGDRFKLVANPTATENDYYADVVVATNVIHGIVTLAAGTADLTVEVIIFWPWDWSVAS